ncbi:MAG: uroporphyrinogen-III synthase, partial [Terriglobales bacterium]
TFTSSSTVRNFADLLGTKKPTPPAKAARPKTAAQTATLKSVQFASIGPVTSATLRELEFPVSIEAREFTMGGLIRAIVLARYAEPSK